MQRHYRCSVTDTMICELTTKTLKVHTHITQIRHSRVSTCTVLSNVHIKHESVNDRPRNPDLLTLHELLSCNVMMHECNTINLFDNTLPADYYRQHVLICCKLS